MLRKTIFFGTLVGIGFLFGAISGAIAADIPSDRNMQMESSKTSQFKAIDQPLTNKILITVVGAGLIGAELWWFLLSKPKAEKAEAESGIQEVTVVVDGGYEPSRIVVNAGQLVRLNFLRRDPSSCLEEVRLADFHIAQHLELNKTTTIEFTPPKAGNYEFACGMNMFRGAIEAK